MKKRLKYFIFIFFTLVIISGCNKNNNVSEELFYEPEIYTKEDVGIVSDIKKIEYEIPSINLYILGHYADTITREKLNGIKVYNFDAIVEARNHFYKRNFTGIKMLDFIEWLNLDLSIAKQITFEGDDFIKQKYTISELNNNSWILFSMNNAPILNDPELNPIMFIQIDEDISTWSYGIKSITVS